MLHLAHGQINVAIMVVGEIILAVSAKTDRGIMNWMARSENTVHRKKRSENTGNSYTQSKQISKDQIMAM